MKYIFNKYIVPVWWREYRREFIKGDLSAGFTIGVMLIPQGMAYAMLAGMPPIYGLYAAVFPPMIYAWLGSSRRLAVGPAAITCILVTIYLLCILSLHSVVCCVFVFTVDIFLIFEALQCMCPL